MPFQQDLAGVEERTRHRDSIKRCKPIVGHAKSSEGIEQIRIGDVIAGDWFSLEGPSTILDETRSQGRDCVRDDDLQTCLVDQPLTCHEWRMADALDVLTSDAARR